MGKGISLEIDGKKVEARDGMTILEAAKEVGVVIPTLCYQDGLTPYGACGICRVEIENSGRSRIVASCAYPVEDGLKVKTRSSRIDRIRRTIIELVAPTVAVGGVVTGELRILAEEYEANTSRFASKSVEVPMRCILCGLCVRYCSEIIGMNTIGFVGRGIERQVVFYPKKAQNCQGCRSCHKVCPTGKIPAETDGDVFPGFCLHDYLFTHGTRLHSLSSLPQEAENE